MELEKESQPGTKLTMRMVIGLTSFENGCVTKFAQLHLHPVFLCAVKSGPAEAPAALSPQ